MIPEEDKTRFKNHFFDIAVDAITDDDGSDDDGMLSRTVLERLLRISQEWILRTNPHKLCVQTQSSKDV